jgi:hypothetical protein
MKALHPCLECRLPDCDEESKRCGLRVAICAYKNALKRKAMTPQIRQRHNLAFTELYGRDRNERRRVAKRQGEMNG